MRTRLAWAVPLSVAVIIAASAVVSAAVLPLAFDTNADCLACHEVTRPASTKADFVVDPVDKKTACRQCHWEPAGAHPFHLVGMPCSGCHPGWGRTNNLRVPTVETAYGWFATGASADVTADQLHMIHSNPAWPAGVTGPKTISNGGALRQCSSCHAAASCSACHADPVLHGDHTYDPVSGTRDAAPWVGTVGSGTPVGVESVLTAVTGEITCAAVECHPFEAFSPGSVVQENDPRITYTGTWSRVPNLSYLGGSATYLKYAGSQATIQVTEGSVTWISLRGPYSGIAEVLIDDELVDTIDLYSPSYVYQAEVFSVTFGDDEPHTFTVRATGLRNSSAWNHLVYIDAIRLGGGTGEGFVPDCTSCHTSVENDHHEVHDASASMRSGCQKCHSTYLDDEHLEHGLGCATCHGSDDLAVQRAVDEGLLACEACHESNQHGGPPTSR